MKMKKGFKGNGGFTLMELLIVIVILGFLLGMVVPRLADVVSGDSIDNVCDSNNKSLRYYTKLYLDQKGRFPANMTNLVVQTGTGYVRPHVEDKDVDNGAETLALEFYQRNCPTVRTISAGEASELIDMGIARVCNLNDMEGSGHDAFAAPGTAMTDDQGALALATDAKAMEKVRVATGLGMAFVGDIATAPTAAGWDMTLGTAIDYPCGNPNWYGRIILGIGPDCSLVTDGMIQAAALCPGGVQNSDNVVYNNYCVILPRLQGTIDETTGTVDGAELTFVSTEDDTVEHVEVYSAQEPWQFDFTCPEGHKWPDNDNDFWKFVPAAP